MSINNTEGTFSRENIQAPIAPPPPNPLEDNSNIQEEEIKKPTFSRQRTIKPDGKESNSYSKRQLEREEQNIKGHVFLEPKWDNSFHLEKPILAILLLIIIGIYFYTLITNYIEGFWPKVIWGLFIFALYAFECYTNGVVQYLDNKMTVTQLQEYLQKMRNFPFSLQYKVTAYHYEHTETYNRSSKRYESTRHTVETYDETFNYPIKQVVDLTEDSTELFEKASVFRIHSFVSFSYGNKESEKYYEDLKTYAENKSKRMDVYQTKSEKIDCPGLLTNILAYSDSSKLDPIFSKTVYFIYCVVGLSLLYRILLNRKVSFVEHCIHKQIYYDPIVAATQLHDTVFLQIQQQQLLENQQKILENQEKLFKQQQEMFEKQLNINSQNNADNHDNNSTAHQ